MLQKELTNPIMSEFINKQQTLCLRPCF